MCLSGHDLSWEWESDLAVVELLNVGSSAVLGSDGFDLNNDYNNSHDYVTENKNQATYTEDLDGSWSGSVSGTHVSVSLGDGVSGVSGSVFTVHVVGSRS